MSEVSKNSKFTVRLPLIKAWQDEQGEMWVEGVASSTSLDRQRERMTKNAIAQMQQYQGIDLLPSHNAGPLEELGTVEDCWADNESFRVKARLDELNPRAVRLFKRLVDGNQYGLSVGGRVAKAFWDFDQEAGARIRYIDDVVIDHVALCRPQQAANPDTYLAALAKAAESVTQAQPSTADSEEDIIRRLGQAALSACRRLWPFGKDISQPTAEAESGETTEITELRQQNAALRKQLEQVSAELAAGSSQQEAPQPADPEPGQRQSMISEQRYRANKPDNFWKGVL